MYCQVESISADGIALSLFLVARRGVVVYKLERFNLVSDTASKASTVHPDAPGSQPLPSIHYTVVVLVRTGVTFSVHHCNYDCTTPLRRDATRTDAHVYILSMYFTNHRGFLRRILSESRLVA